MKLCKLIVCFVLLAWRPLWAQTGSLPPKLNEQTGQKQDSKAPSGQIADDPARQADIRRLMELTGATALVNQMLGRMLETLKPLMVSALPAGEYREKLVDLFYAKFQSEASAKQLLDLAIPIYAKYFSDEEIKGLIQFYQTPLGRKTITALPQLTAEMAAAGKQWGQEQGRKCMEEVLAEHPDLAEALQEAGKSKQ